MKQERAATVRWRVAGDRPATSAPQQGNQLYCVLLLCGKLLAPCAAWNQIAVAIIFFTDFFIKVQNCLAVQVLPKDLGPGLKSYLL